MDQRAVFEELLSDFRRAEVDLLNELRPLAPEAVEHLEGLRWLILFLERRVHGTDIALPPAPPLPTKRHDDAGMSLGDGEAPDAPAPVQRSENPRRRILQTLDSGALYTVKGLTDALLSAGWRTDSANPQTVVRASLRRLAKAGSVEQVRDGRYRKKQAANSKVMTALATLAGGLVEANPLRLDGIASSPEQRPLSQDQSKAG